jgi:UDP-GlcNAc:undecaprenyl-phosphate/decaprenyl-phosphate GlcNAc-1-phosphate transferase
MRFPADVYVLAFAGGAAGAAASLPLWRLWCRRIGLVDDPGHRKIHSTPVPLAGGFAVFTGIAVVLLGTLLAVLSGGLEPEALEKISHGLGRRAVPLLAVFAGGLGMLFLGGCDDRFELRPGLKFAGQALIALLVAAGGVRLTLFVPSTAFSYAMTVLWIVAITNAFNLSDNMNGLCAGLGLVGAGLFAAVAGHHGQYLVASFALLVAGALAGYLPYNYPRASVFLGDAGSHLVGYLMAVLAILPHFYSRKLGDPRPLAVLSPLVILAVPILDTAAVLVTRTLAGRPFWVGDTNHLSHRLVRAGLGKPAAVAALWGLAILIGLAALL